jgi:hypothetical protein
LKNGFPSLLSFIIERLTHSKGGSTKQREKITPKAMTSFHLPHNSTDNKDYSSQIIGPSAKRPFGVHLSRDPEVILKNQREIKIEPCMTIFMKLICLTSRHAQTCRPSLNTES